MSGFSRLGRVLTRMVISAAIIIIVTLALLLLVRQLGRDIWVHRTPRVTPKGCEFVSGCDHDVLQVPQGGGGTPIRYIRNKAHNGTCVMIRFVAVYSAVYIYVLLKEYDDKLSVATVLL